jgi:hypothetical protein
VKRLLIVFIILLFVASTVFAGDFYNTRSEKTIAEKSQGRGPEKAVEKSNGVITNEGMTDGGGAEKPGGGSKG